MNKVTFVCPKCKSRIEPEQLRTEWGSFGVVDCPSCGAALRYSPPYPLIILWGSLPILCYFLLAKGMHEGVVYCVKLALLWFVGSIAVSVLASQIRPLTLKLARDDDKPVDLFNGQNK